MRFIKAWPQAWQAKQAGCQQRRSPARAANTPYSPGLSRSLHCRGCVGGEVCWLLRGDTTHPPSFSPDFPPNPNLTVPPRPLRKPTSTAGSTKNPQTWFPFFLKLAKLSIPNPFFPPESQKLAPAKVRAEWRKGNIAGRWVLHTFSQVHSSGLGGTRRTAPCPRASRLRWAQKSRSSTSSSSPRARQYRSCRNRPPL